MEHPQFEGFTSPNSTYVPNEFFDVLLPKIRLESELKVTLVAIRMTFGFWRNEAPLAQSFFEQATGMDLRAVRTGIAAALLRGTLEIAKKATKRDPTVYRIRFAAPRDLKRELAERRGKTSPQETPPSRIPQTPPSRIPQTPPRMSGKKQTINKHLNKRLRAATQPPLIPELPPASPAFGEMFQTVSLVTIQDPNLKGSQIGKVAKELIAAGYSPGQVQQAFAKGGLWYRLEYSGACGSPPRLNQISEKLPVLLARKDDPPIVLKKPSGPPTAPNADLRPRQTTMRIR